MIKKLLRKIYNLLPPKIREISRSLYYRLDWEKSVYTKFGQDQKKYIFLSITRFLQINRPIKGYYFEFGSHGANTMRMAWDNFHHLFDFTYAAFDSFEGLPEIEDIDKMELFKKGKMQTSENDFIETVARQGLPREKLIIVKGFYEFSLTEELKQRLLAKKAAVVYIDCDLYKSTIPVLNFIKDFLQKGTIIVFDDWNCFFGDPNLGQRRAFKEFRAQNPDLVFEDFVQTNEAKSFIFLDKKQ